MRTSRADVAAAVAGAALVALAAVVGGVLVGRGVPVHAGAAPLFALIRPYAGPGTALAAAVAALLVWFGPVAARRWPWPRLLAATAAATLLWTASLALVRPGGLLEPLATDPEYLAELPRIEAGSLGDFLSGFVGSIPADAAQPWRTHVAGHPPGMTLVFVLLARAGLGGPGPAAAACLLAWAAGVVLVAATVRRLAGEATARAALPFLVLTPAVVWAGVSADALLAGLGALGLYLLTRDRLLWAVPAGLVLGLCCFLSYGAPLLGVPALAVVLAARPSTGRAVAVVTVAAGAALVVVLAFWAAGFAWWEGLSAVHGRYLAGFGGERPYAYWVWANLAALVVAAGPATMAGVRRLAHGTVPVRWIVGGALAAVVLASLSGMSKAETERIWLPWTLWLPVACALLPAVFTRRWLAVQVLVALAVESLLLTPW